MPPYLDSYGLTDRRDELTITHFVDSFVDRTFEERGDEGLNMIRLGFADPDRAEWEWEPARTITHTIHRGLEYPRRAYFVTYQGKFGSIPYATICFTIDDKVVFGLSINREGMKPQDLGTAKELLDLLFGEYGCYIGIISTDEPPPFSEDEFQKTARSPLTVFTRGIIGSV